MNNWQDRSFKILLLLAALGMLFVGWDSLKGQNTDNEGQEPPPTGGLLHRNKDPHQNPGCSLRGGPEEVRCKCPAMVMDVQRQETRECWMTENPALKYLEGELFWDAVEMLSQFPSETVLECLEKVPDHCDIISKGPWWYEQWGFDYDSEDDLRICGTRCQPQNCHCDHDTSCKAHGEGEIFVP